MNGPDGKTWAETMPAPRVDLSYYYFDEDLASWVAISADGKNVFLSADNSTWGPAPNGFEPRTLESLPRENDGMLQSKQTVVDSLPQVLDACCGSRMFWFQKNDTRAVFVDVRNERHTLPDISSKDGQRELIIAPDIVADFRSLPFSDNSFYLVVFDPPHFRRNGQKSWVGAKYGTLSENWQEILRDGFSECFRVLKPNGTLVFKWCETEIPLSKILSLTDEKPLFGHKSGKNSNTHWVTFMKNSEHSSNDNQTTND